MRPEQKDDENQQKKIRLHVFPSHIVHRSHVFQQVFRKHIGQKKWRIDPHKESERIQTTEPQITKWRIAVLD